MKFDVTCSYKGDKAYLASHGIHQPPFSPLAYSVAVKGNSRGWELSVLLCDLSDQVRKQMLKCISLEPKLLHILGPAWSEPSVPPAEVPASQVHPWLTRCHPTSHLACPVRREERQAYLGGKWLI